MIPLIAAAALAGMTNLTGVVTFERDGLAFFFWKPKKWRKGLKAKLESALYSIAVRRRAKSCGRDLYILGPGVNVTSNGASSSGSTTRRLLLFAGRPIDTHKRYPGSTASSWL